MIRLCKSSSNILTYGPHSTLQESNPALFGLLDNLVMSTDINISDVLLSENLHSVDDRRHEDQARADDRGYWGAHRDRGNCQAETVKSPI